MRILHLTTARTWRGGEIQLRMLISSQVVQHDVQVLTPDDGIFAKDEGFDLCRVDTYSSFIGGVLHGLYRLHQHIDNVDVIHAHDSKSHTLLYLYARMTTVKIPMIVTRHTAFGVSSSSYAKYNDPNIRALICVSRGVRQSLLPVIKDQGCLHVIPSSIDTSSRAKQRFDRVAEVDDRFVVVYIAALTSEKRHDKLLEIAEASTRRGMDNVAFYIVGDGDLYKTIEQDIQDRKLSDRVYMTGYIDNVKNYLNGVDVLLHTCENEALGTSILEAMNCAIPVIVHYSVGPREYIVHGENGYLIPDYQIDQYLEALEVLMLNRDEYARISAASVETAKTYDIHLMSQRIQKLYEREIAR